MSSIPVIAIDGPSASGKGTVAQLVAQKLGFHYLDSGALYRIVALAAKRMDIGWQADRSLAEMASKLRIEFVGDNILLDGADITEDIRTEEMGKGASEVAIHPSVRKALFALQRNFKRAPGLVADGRDMGSVVFKEATLKIFLTASAEARAERRYKQLIGKGLAADYSQILQDLQQRDMRDGQRNASPLIQTPDAVVLDTTDRNIDEAVRFVLDAYKKTCQKRH